MKTFVIFTEAMKQVMKKNCAMPHRPNLAAKHYRIEWYNENIRNDMEYDYSDVDYDIIKTDKGAFADSLMNDIWPFLRAMWRARGGYHIELKFRPQLEIEEWGERNWAPIWANYTFVIDDEGSWKAKFIFNYQQTHTDHVYPEGNFSDPGPVWKISEFNWPENNSASSFRARKLAWRGDKSKEGLDPWNAWSPESFQQKVDYFTDIKYKDFSFKHKYIGKGHWTH